MELLTVEPLAIPEVRIVTTRYFGDPRGTFTESWNRRRFAEAGVDLDFVQDNLSVSARRGTVRGLHFQRPPSAQAKLVMPVRGAIWDVAVDLRRGSPTYGRWCGARLEARDGRWILIPRGFAHGFCTLEDETVVLYKVDGYYDPAADAGIRWDDPDLAIDWPVTAQDAVLSDKDRAHPALADLPPIFETA